MKYRNMSARYLILTFLLFTTSMANASPTFKYKKGEKVMFDHTRYGKCMGHTIDIDATITNYYFIKIDKCESTYGENEKVWITEDGLSPWKK